MELAIFSLWGEIITLSRNYNRSSILHHKETYLGDTGIYLIIIVESRSDRKPAQRTSAASLTIARGPETQR